MNNVKIKWILEKETEMSKITTYTQIIDVIYYLSTNPSKYNLNNLI